MEFILDVSEEEFWEISNEDTEFELIDGVLVIHSPASTEHEDIFGYLHQIIGFFVDNLGIGKVLGSRLVMRLSPKWNPEPDLMLLLASNYDKIKETRVEGPADLVIEILSKSTRELDLTKKIPHYLEAGVKEVWVINPASRQIFIHRPNAIGLEVPPDASRIPSEILPELNLEPAWIWNREDMPASKVIKKMIQAS